MADLSRRGISPDDALPPVEPPSAGFLVQLFLVPAIIVGSIFAIVLPLQWLAHRGSDPQNYVRQLRRDTEGRWQAALNLANELRGPGGEQLKVNATLAGDLAAVLDGEVKSGRATGTGRSAEQSQTLCVYLCRALGEFALPEAAAPLVAQASAVDRPEIARAAVEALAVLATNLAAGRRSFPDPAAVSAAVLEASRAQDRGLRSSAAFALGVIGGEGSRDRLEVLCGDLQDDVRYNAALGLARQGSVAAWDTLAEMLALPDVVVPTGDERSQADRYRRAMVVVNALTGVGLLVNETEQPPPERITAAVAALEGDAVNEVRREARALRKRIDRLTAEAGGP